MDISALLSPSEAPTSDSNASRPASNGGSWQRNDSPAVRQSPRPRQASHQFSPSRHVAMQHRPNAPSPSASQLSNNGMATSHPHPYAQPQNLGTQQQDQRPQLHRASTSGMDTLADLASMQQRQQPQPAGAQPVRQNSGDPNGLQQRPRLDEIQRQHSGSRNSIDMSKLDTPKPQPRPLRVLRSASLDEAELSEATQLFAHLAEHPHAYESHLQLTRLLRRGIRNHAALDPHTNEPRQDPRTYELIPELREANEAMSERFAIGEQEWQDRLEDAQIWAHSLDDCAHVTELHRKAVDEEAGSTKLWQTFGNWMLMMYQAAHGMIGVMPQHFERRWAMWSEEDKNLAKELFQRDLLLDIWRQGAEATMYNIDDSQLVWDNYITLVLDGLERAFTAEARDAAKTLFEKRLFTPHKEWDHTFQQFSQFVSRFEEPSRYESTMMQTKNSSNAKAAIAQYEARSVFEDSWRSAQKAADAPLEWSVVSEYLEWELGQSRKKKKFSFNLSKALYQRALLRFPHVTTLWEDLFLFLADEPPEDERASVMLPAMVRGTQHCPWSGTLWGHYIRAGELEGLSFDKMSHIKHRATSKGLLDASPIEEHVIINSNWCSYLRRRAFERGEVEEDELDVTEVGIRSALEETGIIGRKREGDSYQGDPKFRLERIYIRFCTQVGDGAHLQTARSIWQSLVPKRGQDYEFWQAYYQWERDCWLNSARNTKATVSPKFATDVLVQGISNSTTDWPEKLIENLLRHAEDYDGPQGQLAAVIYSRKASKKVEKRRMQERIAAQEAAIEQQQESTATQSPELLANGKRKREAAEEAYDNAFKKVKPDIDEDAMMVDAIDAAPSQLKRDRENATVVVKDLPANVHGRRVRNFFRDCGDIMNIKVTPAETTSTAEIEFKRGEDALAAVTRDGKDFEGSTIRVQRGTGWTIWCTNYPAAADEAYIRGLFEEYGEIEEIRFPSLQGNTHRRFCYIQFKTSAQAQRASAKLDGLVVKDGEMEQKLTAKISDPTHRQDRSGALEEGRELYVRDVDWSGTEAELKEIFAKYGHVQSVRIPLDMNGKSKGHAFIIFETPEQAQKALELNKTKFKSRILDVSIAESKKAKRSATTVVRNRISASPSPGVNGHSVQPQFAKSEEIEARTFALLDVPDTVNDSRVRALAEPHGALAKVVLLPQHGGAILEYTDAASAGKASLALEGAELAPGRRIRTGTRRELLAAKAERKDQAAAGINTYSKRENGTLEAKTPFGAGSGVIRRPGQQSGRRGGLGVKRGGAKLGGSRATAAEQGPATVDNLKQDVTDGADKQSKPKNNAEFKAMFLKAKE